MARSPGHFTGRHMAAILIGFFGVVIAVNLFMARLASGTFGGTVVDNSYVASQKYNGWIEQGRQQAARKLKLHVARLADGRVRIGIADAARAPMAGQVDVVAEHPLGRTPSRPLVMTGGGPWTSADPLPAGRWRLKIEARVGGTPARFVADLP